MIVQTLNEQIESVYVETEIGMDHPVSDYLSAWGIYIQLESLEPDQKLYSMKELS